LFLRQFLTAFLFLVGVNYIRAQDWGPMNLVYWENHPLTFPGFFNPSYYSSDSILYCDDYWRLSPDWMCGIYYSHLDSIIYDEWWWSDPVALPAPINIEGYYNAMPFVTVNGDSLFFCSDRLGSMGGMDIWLSVKVDEEWSEPINLGDSINTELNENGPCYARESQVLYFDRNEGTSRNLSIYKSERINGVWQSAEALPEIINIPDNATYGAFYDEHENALYYTNQNFVDRVDNLKKSIYSDGIWQDPQPLSPNVNGYFYPNYCEAVTTENAFISHDRNLLFYNKWLWEASMCIDFYSYIFFSEAAVGIEEEQEVDKFSLNLNIYPNPSNSVFNFEFQQLENPGSLRIYNICGELVYEFRLKTDDVYLFWNGTDKKNRQVASGVYFAVLENGAYKISEQFVLLK